MEVSHSPVGMTLPVSMLEIRVLGISERSASSLLGEAPGDAQYLELGCEVHMVTPPAP